MRKLFLALAAKLFGPAAPMATYKSPASITLHCMIDLETLSLASNAYIRTLGACFFDATGIRETFYESCDGLAQKGACFFDATTVAWWARQSGSAQAALVNPKKQDLERVLFDFRRWVLDIANIYSFYKDGKDVLVCVWGNGGDFDPVVLSNAYKQYGIQAPWPWYGTRCYRTLKSLNEDIPTGVFEGEKHNALDDAIHQARHAVKIMRKIYW